MLAIVNESFAAVENMLKTANTVLDVIPDLQDGQLKCEQAILDLEHYAEFNKLGRTESSKFVREMNKYRNHRREIKDTLEALTPLAEFFDKHRQFLKELNKALCKSKDMQKKLAGHRHYRPRVLYELFGMEAPKTTIEIAMTKAQGR